MTRLTLERMGKSLCSGPLIDWGLLEEPWPVGVTKDVEDLKAAQLMAKYGSMFKKTIASEKIFDKVGKKPKNKLYEDKIIKPSGVK